MATFECESCGRTLEHGPGRSKGARSIKCVCGGRMLRQDESAPNEMRDMDNELGRDE
ncbi:MAG TPA: hypothetical protein VLU38_01280 [Methanomassiliicoccales archaeon]|nr:hypothetical protein [Methanomassiliicoccales archaeon]